MLLLSALSLIKSLFTRNPQIVASQAVITDRHPFTDEDAWLPRRTVGDALGEMNLRREW